MKTLLRVLWEPTVPELLAIGGFVASILSALLPGANGTAREIMTAALAGLGSVGVVAHAATSSSTSTTASQEAAPK